MSRLRSAGAVVIGKTNLPELAIIGDTEGPAFGMTRNPWNTDRSVGGSSGGSAAAVAAGLCAGATASDGMGSIRIPASNCGLVGLKPHPRPHPADAPEGALVRHQRGGLRDPERGGHRAAALGRRGRRHARRRVARDPGRLRVACRRSRSSRRASTPTSGGRSSETGGRLRTLGHEVEQRRSSYPPVSPSVSASSPESRRTSRSASSCPTVSSAAPRAGPAWGTLSRPRARLGAQEDDSERMRPFFERHDVLAGPVASEPPVRAGEWEGLGAARTFLGLAQVYSFAGEWNLTGQPAISVPVGMQRRRPPDRHDDRGAPRRGGDADRARRAARGRAPLDRPSAASLLNSLPRVRQLRIHDTLTGAVVPVEPREPGGVGIYACGPTVYGRIHVGNARPFIVFSLLQALPRARGLRHSLVVEHHRRERQDLRRRPRARGAERRAGARDDRRATWRTPTGSASGAPTPSRRRPRRSARSSG